VGIVGLAVKPGTDDLRESPLVTLVEALVGKGCEVRVLDLHVAVARLVGANRRYIEEEIPHVASLMCESAADLLAHAEVVVLGNAGEDAAAVLAGVEPRHLVLDLTRGAVRPGPAAPAAA
jgi:GDP-mannose 6-dehydrogenase